MGEHIRHMRILVASFRANEFDTVDGGYEGEAIPLHAVGMTVLRRIILDHYSVRDSANELIFPKIAALGYPANVSGGELWQFSISEENQLAIMHALKANEAEIEEHWIDVGWMKTSAECTSLQYCPGQGGFAANWARPISDASSPTFPRSVKPVFDLGHDDTVG